MSSSASLPGNHLKSKKTHKVREMSKALFDDFVQAQNTFYLTVVEVICTELTVEINLVN